MALVGPWAPESCPIIPSLIPLQTDLEEDDIFILDVYTSIFVWVGSEANEQEKKRAPEIAAEYLKASGGVHQQDTPIITVHSGNEPMLFTCAFS